VGIVLDRIQDADVQFHIRVAWELIAPKRIREMLAQPNQPKELGE
jgi:hypothetical protein